MKKHTIILLVVFMMFVSVTAVYADGQSESADESQVTLTMLMEDVPETHIIKAMLPEFEEKTGIKVNFEIVQYTDMHTKLIPQLMSGKSQYDVIEVDNYWAGEFPAAGWLEPLDSYVQRDGFDINAYIPSMLEMVGYYPASGADKKLYMVPMYNYTMCLLYRQDLIDDPELQAKYKDLYGEDLKVPASLDEFVKISQFMQDNADVYGAAMQAGRGDPIVMEWSNYLFSLGGDYYDSNWNAIINNQNSLDAISAYTEMINTAAPRGVLSYNLDDALRIMSQGKAFSMITYNWMLAQLDDPDKSQVAGKVAIAPMPGEKSLAGGWGWAIAHNSNNKDEAWEFIKWVESFDIAKRRALEGGAPTRNDVLFDSDVLKKYPYYKVVSDILKRSKPVPEFQFSTQMVEIVGRELSLVVAENKDPEEAMNQAAKELDVLAAKAGLK